MKKIIIIILFTISFNCKSQNIVDVNTLTLNNIELLGKSKSFLFSNLGQPIDFEAIESEMDDKNMYIYKFNGANFIIIDDIVDSFEINNSNFLFTSNNIKIGDNIDTLNSVYPLSFNNKSSKHLSIQIMNTDMYVSFHYNSINNLITLIRIGTY
jgi:hypothetical protein